MAELADAYDSGSYEATRAGSSPVWCTKPWIHDFYFGEPYEKVFSNVDTPITCRMFKPKIYDL